MGRGWLRKKKTEMLIKKGMRKGSHPDKRRKILEKGKRGN
jgi:hypothetical protein